MPKQHTYQQSTARGGIMKRVITCANSLLGSDNKLSYNTKISIARQIDEILKKYMDFDYYAKGFISDNAMYDELRLSYHVNSEQRSYTGYCEVMIDDAGEWKDVIASARNEVRRLLLSYGFSNIRFKFQTRSVEEHYTGDWGTVATKFRYLESIEFVYKY